MLLTRGHYSVRLTANDSECVGLRKVPHHRLVSELQLDVFINRQQTDEVAGQRDLAQEALMDVWAQEGGRHGAGSTHSDVSHVTTV
jgi:hypothetical protein